MYYSCVVYPSDFFPTTLMLMASFSLAPECVDVDCWNRSFSTRARGTRNTVVVVVVAVVVVVVEVVVVVGIDIFLHDAHYTLSHATYLG